MQRGDSGTNLLQMDNAEAYTRVACCNLLCQGHDVVHQSESTRRVQKQLNWCCSLKVQWLLYAPPAVTLRNFPWQIVCVCVIPLTVPVNST